MKFKELIKQSYEDLKNLTINWFNVLSLTVIIFILCHTAYWYTCGFTRWCICPKETRREK